MNGRNIGLLLGQGALLGASFMLIKVALREMSPVTLVAYRLGLGALGLLGFYAAGRLRAQPGSENRAQIIWHHLAGSALLLALFNVVLPYLAIAWSEVYISSGDAAILTATAPIFTAILVFLLGTRSGETMTWGKAIGVLIGFLGVALVVSGGAQQPGVAATDSWLGHGAVLFAALCYAGSSLYARHVFNDLPAIIPALMQTLIAALLLLPSALFDPPPHGISWAAAGALIGLGLGGIALSFLIYFTLLKSVGATRTMTVTYLLPITALIYGTLLLGEPLQAAALAGLGLVLLGIAIAQGLYIGLAKYVRRR